MKNIVVEGQISLFDLPEEEFKITDEEITEVLLNRYKKDIYIHFINEPYNNALFLKDTYGIGGEHGYVLKAYRWSDVDYDSNGLRITKEEGSKKAEITLNWSQVARRIEKLIKENRYLTKEEKIKYGLYENFKIDSEDIERVLMFKHGIGSVEKRIKVYKNFISNGCKAICSKEFLKETYGTSGSIRGKTSKGIRYSDNYKENGIEIEKGEIKLFMPWLSINIELHKLIKNNIFLTDEEKVKYGLVKETPVPNKPKEENNDIDKIIKHYKDTCRFIVKGEYGLMVHMKGEAMFYDFTGKLKSKVNSNFIPPKPLGEVLIDNIGAYKKSTVLDKKVHEWEMYDGFEVINTVNILTKCGRETLIKGKVAFINSYGDNHVNIAFPNEYGGTYGISISINQFEENFKSLNRKIYPKKKEIWDGEKWVKNPESDIKFTKGQAVKVCLGDKERAGEVWRLQSNGCVSVLFKDTNSVGAYPRKFVKPVEKNTKPKIKLLRDLKDLREDFKKGNEYEVWQEKEKNYVIYLEGTFYEPLKENCERVN